MKILWKYLKPHRWLAVFSLILAGIAQLLTLLDPVIFGKIIDGYALNPGNRTEQQLVNGIIWWLAIAVAVAMAARVAKTFQEYLLRLVVQKFGVAIF
ncbi:MAG: hypothetical protein ABIP30_15315 [Ferruginibacter sp.]